ncbi:MAG: DNA repair protein RecO C-terminal domain-containing protein [Spirochaetaceae bacterium]|jgi:DNA repair protein RecO (recombination protein O)|nr:DNA repair protein RecO C-terminal domain-containing protein [Spirochaetaceae bacterium]
MSRTFTYSALVLRVRAAGESNREAWFLTAEEGILRATLYGGPKSRLRAHVAPFHRGLLWIYHDPIRDTRKVTDFDVRAWRPGIRETYHRSMAALSLAETVLASHGGGGGWERALSLVDKTLDALETADEATGSRLVIHFLWNWAELLGIRPPLDRCSSCACEAGSDEVLWYAPGGDGLLCASCGGNRRDLLGLFPGGRRWLKTVESLDPALLSRYTPERESFRQVRVFVYGITAAALGRRPESWAYL